MYSVFGYLFNGSLTRYAIGIEAGASPLPLPLLQEESLDQLLRLARQALELVLRLQASALRSAPRSME